MIRYVTFDLWETLIADSPELDGLRSGYRVNGIQALLEKQLPGIDLGVLKGAHQRTWEICSESWAKAVDLGFSEQVKLFLRLIDERTAKSISSAEFDLISEIYANAVLAFRPVLIDGVEKTLADLSKKGFRMGLICNTGRTPGFMLRKLLEDYRILNYFQSALFSNETLIRKPNPEIFYKSIRELKAVKDETVHVGDSWENDILGARAAGLRAIWVNPNPNEARECKKIRSVAELSDDLIRL